MDKLQEDKPGLFPSPVMYDGKAIMFSKHKLALADPEAKKPVESKQVCTFPLAPLPLFT